MRDIQDTFETSQQSLISAIFNLHDCTFNVMLFNAAFPFRWYNTYKQHPLETQTNFLYVLSMFDSIPVFEKHLLYTPAG